MARALNRFFLFCRLALAFSVGVETFFGCGCLVGIEFEDFFQVEFLSITLFLG